MAEVYIVDIDGEQWDIKDMPLTRRVAILEQLLTVETKGNEEITLEPGFSASEKIVQNIVQYGNITQCNFVITNLAGNGIGADKTIKFGTCNLKVKATYAFVLRDYITGNTVWLSIASNGGIYLSRSTNITPGNNALRGGITFITQ